MYLNDTICNMGFPSDVDGPGAKFLQSFFKLNVVVSNDNTIQLSSEEIQDDADIEVPSTNDKITHDTFHDEEIDLSDTNIETDDQQLIGIKALQAIFADTKFKSCCYWLLWTLF